MCSVFHCAFNLNYPNEKWCWASFMSLLDIYISSLVKCLFKLFAHFWIRLFSSSFLNYKKSLYILDTNSLSEMWFAVIFSQSVSCLIIFSLVFFEAPAISILMTYNLSNFLLWILFLLIAFKISFYGLNCVPCPRIFMLKP